MGKATNPRRASRVSKREKPLIKYRTPQGVVYVTYWAMGIHPTVDRWCSQQSGYRRERGCLVFVQRWLDQDDWTEWGEWIERSRTERLRTPKKVLPKMTAAEKDAWADWAYKYLQRDEVVHTGELSKLMPGWDDVHTFEPGRTPDKEYGGPWLWDRTDFGENWAPAAKRARALCGLALRRLVKQGRAIKFGGADAYGLKQ